MKQRDLKKMTNNDRKNGAVDKPTTEAPSQKYRDNWEKIWGSVDAGIKQKEEKLQERV